MSEYNQYQLEAAENYCGGEFLHLVNKSGIVDNTRYMSPEKFYDNFVGDSLFLFLMRELADVESASEAEERVRTALADLEEVSDAFAAMQPEEGAASNEGTLDSIAEILAGEEDSQAQLSAITQQVRKAGYFIKRASDEDS